MHGAKFSYQIFRRSLNDENLKLPEDILKKSESFSGKEEHLVFSLRDFSLLEKES